MVMEIDQFISQFETSDRNLAKIAIEKLQLISNEQLETYFNEEIIKRYSNGPRTAFFMITQQDDQDYSSSDKIGYLIENIARQYSRYIVVTPTLASMRAERIKRIVLVDDGIGSGRRVVQFLKSDIFKSIRSWISYKKCSVEILSYFLYEIGKDYIQKKTKIISNFVSNLYIDKDNSVFQKEIINILLKYGKKTLKRCAALGYRNVNGFLVFEHGIPNSIPSIFWSDGVNNSWKALFPKRGISRTLIKYFIDKSSLQVNVNAIADLGKYRLAINLLEQIENKRISRENIDHLTILSLLQRGIARENFGKYIVMGTQYQNDIFNKLYKWEYIDKNDKITALGKYVLERFLSKGECKNSNFLVVYEYLPEKFGGAPITV